MKPPDHKAPVIQAHVDAIYKSIDAMSKGLIRCPLDNLRDPEGCQWCDESEECEEYREWLKGKKDYP